MVLLLVLSVVTVVSCSNTFLTLRGGLVPQAEGAGADYYEKFTLDYGCEDNTRIAGSTRGLIKSGKLSTLPTSDPFIKWLNEHLDIGEEELTGRVKPYYAADFGTKAELKKGENPKIIIGKTFE